MKIEYRIIHNDKPRDPCCWQLQKRTSYLFLFNKWEEVYSFSSIKHAGDEIFLRVNK